MISCQRGHHARRQHRALEERSEFRPSEGRHAHAAERLPARRRVLAPTVWMGRGRLLGGLSGPERSPGFGSDGGGKGLEWRAAAGHRGSTVTRPENDSDKEKKVRTDVRKGFVSACVDAARLGLFRGYAVLADASSETSIESCRGPIEPGVWRRALEDWSRRDGRAEVGLVARRVR